MRAIKNQTFCIDYVCQCSCRGLFRWPALHGMAGTLFYVVPFYSVVLLDNGIGYDLLFGNGQAKRETYPLLLT